MEQQIELDGVLDDTEQALLRSRYEDERQARRALQSVVRFHEFGLDGYCLWCTGERGQHSADCMRQAALELCGGLA